jgi:hypothetical protein
VIGKGANEDDESGQVSEVELEEDLSDDELRTSMVLTFSLYHLHYGKIS